jgi:hypothetical protein
MDEHAASIFRVQKLTERIWLDYMGRLHGKCSFRTKRRKQEREPGLLDKAYSTGLEQGIYDNHS